LNRRPRAPKARALTRLRYTPQPLFIVRRSPNRKSLWTWMRINRSRNSWAMTLNQGRFIHKLKDLDLSFPRNRGHYCLQQLDQFRNIYPNNFLHDLVVYVSVFVCKNVPQANDTLPRQFRMGRLKLITDFRSGFSDNLDLALDGSLQDLSD
jgi:hypothetical protein